MTNADRIFISNCRNILCTDKAYPSRAHWMDGVIAYAKSVFGLVNRYDLSKEFPILTLRRTYWKTAYKELLWIYQKCSNNINDLDAHVWDEWADDTGSIGKAYGYQIGMRVKYPEGSMNQIEKVIYDLHHNPFSRRIIINMYNIHDLPEMALYPCAYSMTFNVKEGKLNAILNQRSQDMLAANNWNVVQYALLVHMLASETNLEVGELVHVIADAHIYDRHIPIIKEIIKQHTNTNSPQLVYKKGTKFYDFTQDSFNLVGYSPNETKYNIEIAI